MQNDFVTLHCDRINHLISKQNLKRGQIAHEVGIDLNLLRRWLHEPGIKVPRYDAQALADYLRCSLSSISTSLVVQPKSSAMRSAPQPESQAHELNAQAISTLHNLDIRQAQMLAEQAIRLAPDKRDEEEFWESKSIVARILLQDDVPLAIEKLYEVLQSTQEKSIANISGKVLTNLGSAFRYLGNIGESISALDLALELFDREAKISGRLNKIAVCHALLVESYLLRGDSFQARHHLSISRQYASQGNHPVIEAVLDAKFARILLLEGKSADAQQLLDSIVRDELPVAIQLEFDLVELLILLDQGDYDQAYWLYRSREASLLNSHRIYWLPLLSYIQAQRQQDDDTELACQQFFDRLKAASWIEKAQRLGSFRDLAKNSFLRKSS